jgi:hypothetical protein
MTVKEASEVIGRTFEVRAGEFGVLATVQDVKVSFGKIRFQVSPLAGSGSAWIEVDRIIGWQEDSGLRRGVGW